MYCAVAKNEAVTGCIDKVRKVIKEKRNPLAARQEGFIEVFLMMKPDGEFMLLTFWETEEQANAWYENSEHLALAPVFAPIVKSPYKQPKKIPRHIFEVQDHVKR